MIKENPPKKIFVIRSATRILNKTLISLREEFPGCHITVLVPESAKESMEQESQVDEVLTIPDQRRISVSSYGWDNLRKLQENKFDLAIALYNIDHGLGYSNIDLLACAVKAKSVRGYNSKGTYKEVTSSTAKKKFFFLDLKNFLIWNFTFVVTANLSHNGEGCDSSEVIISI